MSRARDLANRTIASAALPKAGGAMTGAITTNSTFDGIDIATDVAANTAKTGITSGQASAITANTAKVTNHNQTLAEINALDVTELGTVTSGTLSHGTTLQAYVDTSNAGVIFPSGHVIQVHSFVEDISTGLTMNSATYNATYSKSTTITPKFSDTKLHVSITSQIVLNGGTNNANTIGFVAIFEGTVSTIRQDSRIGCNLPSSGSDFFIPANLNYIGDSGTAGVAQTFGICVRNYGTSYNNYIGWSTEGCTNEVSIIIKEVVA